jgi:ribosomal protein L32
MAKVNRKRRKLGLPDLVRCNICGEQVTGHTIYRDNVTCFPCHEKHRQELLTAKHKVEEEMDVLAARPLLKWLENGQKY